MTIEQKAKAYDEALTKSKEFLTLCEKCGAKDTINFLKDIFSELKESEDERIRKRIIQALHGDVLDMEETTKAIAWLEKQGEQKSIWHNEDKEPQRDSLILLVMQSGTPIVAKIIEPNHTFNHGERWAYIDDLLEKQGEQKPIDKIQLDKKYKCIASPRYSTFIIGEIYKPEDKFLCSLMNLCYDCFEPIEDNEQKPANDIEPKFYKGEWITNGGYTWKIVDVKPLDYILQSQDGNIVDDTISHVDEQFHLWTIQDAKDGDVLTNDFNEIFIFKNINKDIVISHCSIIYRTSDAIVNSFDEIKVGSLSAVNFYPATKEQRDTLMKAMADAGWGFDFEKKKLKKIDSQVLSNSLNTGKDEPTKWSEEDEKMVDKILTPLAIRYPLDIYQPMYNWLKSLKQRIGG